MTGTVMNAVLILLKFIAGIVGRSSAMLADAVHSFSDFITDIIVIIFVRIAGKPCDGGHAYGHGKYETLATLVIGLILMGAGVALMINGLEKVIGCLNGHPLPAPAMTALIVAVVSIVSKEWLFRFTEKKGRKINSPAVIANALHHRSDAFSSAGTLAGIAGAMFLGEKWRILDPIAAMAVSLFIIKSGYDIMKPCVNELLEASLSEAQQHEIMNLIREVPGVMDVHNLRSRRIGNSIAIDLHAKMDGSQSLAEAHAIASRAEQAIRDKYGDNALINIHMEPVSEFRAL